LRRVDHDEIARREKDAKLAAAEDKLNKLDAMVRVGKEG
jgi:hypothetical protein